MDTVIERNRDVMLRRVTSRIMDYAEDYDSNKDPDPTEARRDVLAILHNRAEVEAQTFSDEHGDVNIPAAAAYWLREMLEQA